MDAYYEMLIEILKVEFGVVIIDDSKGDFAINDYIYDSIEFMKLIILIEEKLKMELSDDFLNFEILGSAKGFSKKLDYYIESNKKNNNKKIKRIRFRIRFLL